MFTTYDTEWVRAEHAFRAGQIRDEIRAARRAGSTRRRRRFAHWTRTDG